MLIHGMICSPVMYFWVLLLPSLSGAAVLIIAAALGEYGGIFSAVLFPCMAKVILSQYHRLNSFQRLEGCDWKIANCIITDNISDVDGVMTILLFDYDCRLPNPVYLGTLTAGLIHSTACFLYKILPNILCR